MANKQKKTLFPGRILLLMLATVSGAFAQSPTEPWKKNVSYGDHKNQVLDVYKPEGKGTFPVLMVIHGGGWTSGSKDYMVNAVPLNDILAMRCAVVFVEYRFLGMAKEANIFPPVMGPLSDVRRALQFVRYHAKAWGLNPKKIGIAGGSAGAFSSLWLALSPDQAKPDSNDIIERQSTKVCVVGGAGAQTSLDPAEIRAMVGEEVTYGGHAFGVGNFEQFLARRQEFEKYYPVLSPTSLVSKEDPPIYLFYGFGLNEAEKNDNYYTHSPSFGIGFCKRASQVGARCDLSYGGDTGTFKTRDEMYLAVVKTILKGR